jgi:hypothetical protein
MAEKGEDSHSTGVLELEEGDVILAPGLLVDDAVQTNKNGTNASAQ